MSEYEKSYYPIINVEIFLDEHIDHTYQERLKLGDYSLDDFLIEQSLGGPAKRGPKRKPKK